MTRIRLLLIILALTVFALTSASLYYLESHHFDQWLRGQIIRLLEDRFQLRAELGEVDFRLFGNSVTLEHLRLWNRLYEESDPAISLDRVALHYSLFAYGWPSFSMDHLAVDRLQLNLRENENGRINLANMFASPGGSGNGGFSPVDLEIGGIELRDAVVRYEGNEFLFDSTTNGFDLSLAFRPEKEAYDGRVALEQLSLSVDDTPIPVSEFRTSFELFENRIFFARSEVESDAVSGNFTGEISDLREFTYDFDVHFEVEPSRMEDLLPDLFDSGLVYVNGTFQGTKGDFLLDADVESRELVWRQLRLLELALKLELDREKARFSGMEFRLLEGGYRSEGTLFWSEDRGSSLSVEGTGLRFRALDRLFDLGLPEITGTASLWGELSWPGLGFTALQGTGRVDFRGAVRESEARRWDLAGAGPFRLSAEKVEFSGRAQLPDSRVDYTGEVAFQGAWELETELVSQRGDEIYEVGRALGVIPPDLVEGYPLGLPRSLDSRLRISSQPGMGLRIQGEASAEEIVVRGVSLGAFSTQVLLAPSSLSLSQVSLVTEEGETSGALNLDLDPFAVKRARLATEGVSFALLKRLELPYSDLPLEGFIQGEVTYEEENSLRRGDMTLRVVDLDWEDRSLGEIFVRAGLFGDEIIVEEFTGSLLEGPLQGTGRYDLASGEWEADLRGRSLQLDRLMLSEDEGALQGEARIRLEASGNRDDRELNLEVSSDELRAQGATITDVLVVVDDLGKRNRLRATLEYLGLPYEIVGNFGLDEPYPFSLDLSVSDLPLAPFVAQLTPLTPAELSGSLSMQVEARGELANWREARVEARLEAAQLDVQSYRLELAEEASIALRNGRVDLSGVLLQGQGTDLQIDGDLSLLSESSLNLNVKGEVNLQVANVLIEAGSVLGRLDLDTRVVGTFDEPRIVGTARLSEGFFSFPEVPVPIARAQGEFKFTANQISIDEFSGSTDYGRINATGGIFLEGFVPTRWQVNVFGYGLSVEYPEEVLTTLDVDVDFVRSETSQLLTGVVYIRSAEYGERISIAELILDLSRASTPPPVQSPGQEIVLDISVEAYQSLRINNNLAELVGSGDFSVIGTISQPVILGSLTVDEGLLKLEGNEYEITRGTISFNNPRQTRPYLNFEAETQIREYSITVVIRGPVEDLELAFRSEPPLATASIVSLLAAGQTQEEIFGTEGRQTRSGSLAAYGAGALLSRTVGEVIESETSRLFGFERFSIDPFIDDSQDRNPGARISLGKQITPDLGITYISNLSNNLQTQTVVIQYRLTDWLTAVGTSESDGTIAVDFKIRKRF